MPPVVLIVPFFLMTRSVGLLDTPAALILMHATMNAPFAALLLQDVFAEFPGDLEEAALVDGGTPLDVLWLVVMPLALPALASTMFLCVALSWNEFIIALTLTYRNAVTMPVIIAGAEHTQGPQFWYIATRSLVALVPPGIMAVFAQRLLIRGLTLGAVKG
jgi:multiple sugar transport system permease protein